MEYYKPWKFDRISMERVACIRAQHPVLQFSQERPFLLDRSEKRSLQGTLGWQHRRSRPFWASELRAFSPIITYYACADQ